MLRNRRLGNNRRRNYKRRLKGSEHSNFTKIILLQFLTSIVIVGLVFGVNNDVLNSKKHITTVKSVLGSNIDFHKYSGLLHKKVSEVLSIYDKSELR